MENNIEYIKRDKCCVCGSTDLVFKYDMEDFDSHLGTFGFYKCQNCGMYYTSPYPNKETLPNLYKIRNTRNFDPNNWTIFEYLKDFYAKLQIKKMVKHINNKNLSIADFGCGDGRFSLCFQEVFPDANVTSVDFAQDTPLKLLNCKKQKGNIPQYINTEDFYNNNEKYDIIFLRHVVEHVENPKEFLEKLLNKTTNEGFLYIEVPNVNNGLSILFNKWLPSYAPPYHLVHFTKENMKYLYDKLNAEYEIFQSEMPLMSNILANMLHQDLNNIHRLLGVILHPIQLFLCRKEKTVLAVKLRRKNKIC